MNPIRPVTPLSTVVAVLLFSGLLGLLYESRVLLAVFQSLLAYLLLSFLYVRWVSSRLSAERFHMPRAYDEEAVQVHITVTNRSYLPILFLKLKDWFAPDGLAEKGVTIDTAGTRPINATYSGNCERGRGAFLIGPLTATVSDPLGLFKRTKILVDRSTLLVLPQTFPIRELALSPFASELPSVNMDAPRAGHSTNFYGTREYRPGDNMRRIHWRASARWGRLVLKEFEMQRRCEVSLLLDLDQSVLAGVSRRSTLEVGVRIAASIAEYAINAGHPFQLVADPGNPIFIPAATGQPHLLRILETLARVRAKGSRNYFDLVRSAVRYFSEGSSVVLIVGRPEEEEELGSVLGELRIRQIDPMVILLDQSSFFPLERRSAVQGVDGLVQVCNVMGAAHRVVKDGDDLQKLFAMKEVTA